MQIFVDADACPVVGIVEKIAEKYNISTTLLCDTNHVLTSDYSEVIVVGAGADSCPIIMDSFRAEDLSTEKEERVLALLSELKRQCILTTTLKAEENDKYVKMVGINAIDYTGHQSNKILGTKDLSVFVDLLSGLGIHIQ